jgi:putative transposase
MPRQARIVFPGIPHHVTQRGNRRERVFHTPGDRIAYLDLLGQCSGECGVEVVAYCLMPNHVHLVLVPNTQTGLHLSLKSLHGKYAQRVNRMRKQRGHVWQDRFFSSPLDGAYFANAVRYVELNPVRAGMVGKAEDYEWSSAAGHCGLVEDRVVKRGMRPALLSGIANWSRWLSQGLPEESLQTLRRHLGQNLPCGTDDFVTGLETVCGRSLRFRPRGGQCKETEGTRTMRR